MIVELRTEE